MKKTKTNHPEIVDFYNFCKTNGFSSAVAGLKRDLKRSGISIDLTDQSTCLKSSDGNSQITSVEPSASSSVPTSSRSQSTSADRLIKPSLTQASSSLSSSKSVIHPQSRPKSNSGLKPNPSAAPQATLSSESESTSSSDSDSEPDQNSLPLITNSQPSPQSRLTAKCDAESSSSSDSDSDPLDAGCNVIEPDQKVEESSGSESDSDSGVVKPEVSKIDPKSNFANKAAAPQKTMTSPVKRKMSCPDISNLKRRRTSQPSSAIIHSANTTPTSMGLGRKDIISGKQKKSNEPFRRVKAEEIQLDRRLSDNSFLAKGGAHDSYGFKAHQALSVTRGKAFTKEKNKKKRGSYRGGIIDTTSHSIKFD